MPRPNKILEPTKTYNLLLKEAQYDKLAYAAHQMQKTAREQVAVADLIREAIDRWMLCVPASSVRIGETDRELVKKKDCVDYLRHVALFVGKSRWDCKMWLDKNKQAVLKLGIPYEVS